MKKLFLAFLVVASAIHAASNFPFDVRKIFTQEDRETAMKQIAESDKPNEWKVTHAAFVHCGSFVDEKELATISYSSLKSKIKTNDQRAFDMFIYMFFNKRADVLEAYLADSTFSDYTVCLRKFYIIPSLNACSKVDADVYMNVVLKAFINPRCDQLVKTYSDKEQKTIRTFIKKSKLLPREKALSKLKDLKRFTYKFIILGEDWKDVIEELDMEIKSLS